MRRRALLLTTALALAVSVGTPHDAAGQDARRAPYAGYAYPAGGGRGNVFSIVVGGQNLAGVKSAHASGEGVFVEVVRRVPPLSRKQQGEIRRRLAAARRGRKAKERANNDPVTLPEHPLLVDLEKRSRRDLERIALRFLGAGGKRQPNSQIADTVELDVTIAPDAPPGEREIRLETPRGLTNPVRFRVSGLPEALEDETSERRPQVRIVHTPPLVMNGQILPGDVDRFRFRARAGHQLVVRTEARGLVPYLADAVPGWFQALTALYDAGGKEIAFADDWRFDPDPVLLFQVPEDGEYELEIRDALYRGREDFVYRVTVAEAPFVTACYPLGGPMGLDAIAALSGWNLPRPGLTLDTAPGAGRMRWTGFGDGAGSARIPYAVDDLPESDEIETDGDPQTVGLPVIVNGRIDRPGDRDGFLFKGRRGQEIVAEVIARRLNSPVDSLLRLTGPSGDVLAWNDDHEFADPTLMTHHADSWLRMVLPTDGVYRVDISDAQRHGGEAFVYRLRLDAPRPSFDAFVEPPSLLLSPGSAAPLRIRVVRREGFEGPIEIALIGDVPFRLSGGMVPSGRDSVNMTLTALGGATDEAVAVQLEARSKGRGSEHVCRPVVPAEDVMQAFLYRHLAPAQVLAVRVRGPKRPRAPVELVSELPVRIPVGGSARVKVRVPRGVKQRDLRLVPSRPPEGVTLDDLVVSNRFVTFVLRADAKSTAGYADNLIVGILALRVTAPRKEGGQPRRRWVPLGSLPAIPFEITQAHR